MITNSLSKVIWTSVSIHSSPIDDATSNFGIFHDRDTEIAEWLVHCNEKYGNPQTFKVDWAKSKAMRLLSIAKILHDVVFIMLLFLESI